VETTEKVCVTCQVAKPHTAFTPTEWTRNRPRCKPCVNIRVTQYYATNERYRENRKAAARLQVKTPEASRKHMLKHKYGLTEQQYHEMLADQGGGCALCGATEVGNAQWERKFFYVDHDHATDVVRGLLCHKCNARLGSYEGLRDEIGMDKVHVYLERGKPPDA